MSNLATYTRSLIRAAVSLHAASLARVELAADKSAERAFRKAQQRSEDVRQAEDVVRTMRKQAKDAWAGSNVAEQRSIAVSEAVAAELAALGYRARE